MSHYVTIKNHIQNTLTLTLVLDPITYQNLLHYQSEVEKEVGLSLAFKANGLSYTYTGIDLINEQDLIHHLTHDFIQRTKSLL